MDLPKVDVKKILYATDLSENARYAFAYAVSLADLYKASITFIHVLSEIPDILDKNVLGEGFVTDDIIVVRGNPVEEILKYCEEKNCDLIVMGTHGHGTLADVMMGSTARRVLRRSTKPVLVVRLPEEED